MPKRGYHKAAVLAIGFLAAMGAVAALAQDASGVPTRYVNDYRIGPNDLLVIKVINGDRFNTEARVTQQGKISLPYLGEIDVEGLTGTELEKKLVKVLIERDFLKDPQVSVLIKELQSKRVSVIGAIQTPGPIELLGRQTLLQIISAAGGITREAAREILIIRRLPDGTSSSLHIPIENLIVKGETQFDIPVEAGDIINVQVDRMVQVYVIGQVKSPGALSVLQSRIPTVTQAIAQAGGYTERASLTRVVIKRRDSAGGEKEIKVDVKAILKNKAKDVQLQENDTVYVPQSLF